MRSLSLFLLLASTSTFAANQKYNVELFCQDLNIVLQKVNIHSSNIENHKTTRTPEGGHYKRKLIKNCRKGKCDVVTDKSSPLLVYKPSHPDAQKTGYVAYPSFSLAEEKENLIKAQNAYNLIVENIPVKSVDLLVGNKFENCFENYKFFKKKFDFQTYLGRN